MIRKERKRVKERILRERIYLFYCTLNIKIIYTKDFGKISYFYYLNFSLSEYKHMKLGN